MVYLASLAWKGYAHFYLNNIRSLVTILDINIIEASKNIADVVVKRWSLSHGAYALNYRGLINTQVHNSLLTAHHQLLATRLDWPPFSASSAPPLKCVKKVFICTQ